MEQDCGGGKEEKVGDEGVTFGYGTAEHCSEHLSQARRSHQKQRIARYVVKNKNKKFAYLNANAKYTPLSFWLLLAWHKYDTGTGSCMIAVMSNRVEWIASVNLAAGILFSPSHTTTTITTAHYYCARCRIRLGGGEEEQEEGSYHFDMS